MLKAKLVPRTLLLLCKVSDTELPSQYKKPVDKASFFVYPIDSESIEIRCSWAIIVRIKLSTLWLKLSANLSIVKGPYKLLMSSKLPSSIIQSFVSLILMNDQLIHFVCQGSTRKST